MRRSSLKVLFLVGLLGTIYFAWVWHRLSDRVIVEDRDWPQPWPYPDEWVSDVEQWFDARKPPTDGHIKLHGEFALVRVLTFFAFVLFLQVLIAAAVMHRRNQEKMPQIKSR